jgi:hypothetical protein
MSPVFFGPEVLHKYKADPEKYHLEDRSIRCRGSWSLKTYDINDEGQVHTYLRYLADLPYAEQLYWQSFNQWPKNGLSKRAITTDFKGEFDIEYDALRSLKHKIRQLNSDNPDWWQNRGPELAKAVHYPVTASNAEWANEILALDQLLIEGFRVRGLRGILNAQGRQFQKDWQSLKLLEECLIGAGIDDEVAKAAMKPLRDLHQLRTELKGHSATNKKREQQKMAIAKFGSFRGHFTYIAAECDTTLQTIIDTISADEREK